jgi:hypothetical protein
MKHGYISTFPIISFSAIILLAALSTSAQFPDLTVLDNYSNPSGTVCSIDGKTTATAAKKKWNRLKNRFNIGDSIEAMTFAGILKIRPNKNGKIPAVTNANQSRYISFVGYVRSVFPGGTTGESCNCGAKGRITSDAHIEVVLNPLVDENDPDGKGVITVEVTERSRRLAALGLLDTNIGNDWTTKMLKDQIRGRWVKFTGWLYYDDEHHLESWKIDPTNSKGKNNWRATAWEIHPVMGIEVLPGKPADIP